MAIKDALLPEFDHEMQVTRKVLARVPDGKFGWKPHDKSMTLGRLATHIAQIPGWVKETLVQDGIDMGGDFKPTDLATRDEVLATFDKMVAVARPLIEQATDAQFMGPVDAEDQRPGSLHHAEGRRRQGLGVQPRGSPPRPVERLPPAQRRAGAIDLRPERGRGELN